MRSGILQQVQHHVHAIFEAHEDSDFIYHNEQHTAHVVKAAELLSSHYHLNDEDHQVLITAAWFHDIGYFLDSTQHEHRGAEEAQEFLLAKQVATPLIERVKNCILATSIPQNPHTLVEQILCDADLFHFGTGEFRKRNKLMRKEFEYTRNKPISKKAWTLSALTLLTQHKFHTGYAQDLLSKGKEINMSMLKDKLEKYEDAYKSSHKEEPMKDKDKKHDKEKEDRSDRPTRGIETMFRITSNNQQRLSDMADNKAQIMITVNSIILSILLSVLIRKLEEDPSLTVPAFLLLSVNLATIIFAILATRPHLSSGMFTEKEVDEKHANLLFFGNFHRMNLHDYTKGMLRMMGDSDYLYKSMIKDVHAQGVVLGKKYYLLRICYNIFMFGIIVSVLAFLVATLITKRSAGI